MEANTGNLVNSFNMKLAKELSVKCKWNFVLGLKDIHNDVVLHPVTRF